MTETSGKPAARYLPDPLADAFRRWGYLQADIDPLGRLHPQVHPDVERALEHYGGDVERWRSLYTGRVGFEFMHMVDRERVDWLAGRIEEGPPELDGQWVLGRIMEAELFERFMHSRYVGSKRFSIDGVAGLIPLLDAVLDDSANRGAEFLYIAMSHRGRLNVMKNIVGVPGSDVFAGMEDVDPRSVLGQGDVKYHMGATGRYQTHSGRGIEVHLATNPSHLESVDAVVMGRTRARQERWGTDGRDKMLPITLHGDAAFAGQGITAEVLNFADLRDFTVGGTIRVIVNNLVGFTAKPRDLHSTRFASDAAKRQSIPIIHVNGEAPSALWWVGTLAAEYRYRFKSDVVIDMIGFRRYGHSEVEDPTTTQPVLYEKIKNHPMLWEVYGKRIGEDEKTLKARSDEVMAQLSEGQELGRSQSRRPTFWKLPEFWGRYHGGLHESTHDVDTGVDHARLIEIAERFTTAPDGFNVHPKVEKLMAQRREMVDGTRKIDWGTAEALSFGSLLWDGVCVRLSGQDSARGTFNHRHAVLVDTTNESTHVPLQHLRDEQGAFTVVDSPLSEAAAMGFEYGYSREFPDGLVCWEAQFGDFANGAQVIIDQFLTAAEDKWKLLSGIVLLLPHGYEGQGPEHSSARIERFLQLGAQDNIQVCQPSTSAQYYHLLRRQVLRDWRKPLVAFMPKSLLRAEPACSPIEDLTTGRFQTIIPDHDVDDARVILLCTGKIAHELRAERMKRGITDRAIVTMEQLYPFPADELAAEIKRHGSSNHIIWVQEEPANMGALSYMRSKLPPIIGDRHITTIKRYESASPATGSAKAHTLEQKALIKLAFA